jgi:hypothetical protein
LASLSRMRCSTDRRLCAKSAVRFLAAWVTQGPDGYLVMAKMWIRWHSSSIPKSTWSRRKRQAEFVIIDEPGFAPLDATGAQLLFRFVAAAYERHSLGVASH